MKMFKIFAVVLVVIFACAFSACGKGDTKTSGSAGSKDKTEQTTQQSDKTLIANNPFNQAFVDSAKDAETAQILADLNWVTISDAFFNDGKYEYYIYFNDVSKKTMGTIWAADDDLEWVEENIKGTQYEADWQTTNTVLIYNDQNDCVIDWGLPGFWYQDDQGNISYHETGEEDLFGKGPVTYSSYRDYSMVVCGSAHTLTILDQAIDAMLKGEPMPSFE